MSYFSPPPGSVFFFPREPWKYAREHFEKNAREYFFLPVNNLQKCSREQWKSTREQEKKCPWTSEVAVNHEKCVKSAREPHESARENVQKSARERLFLPVNFVQKVPVNVKMCPWKFLKIWGSRVLSRFTGKKKHWTGRLVITVH